MIFFRLQIGLVVALTKFKFKAQWTDNTLGVRWPCILRIRVRIQPSPQRSISLSLISTQPIFASNFSFESVLINF